jgi:thioredoxin-related protein
MKNILTAIICFCILAATTKTQAQEKAKINWMTIDQAFEAIKKEPRKIVIDVYTDWCGWCKVMDKNTFSDEKVINFVNKKYYAVKLNAEAGGEVQIGAKKYTYPQLASELMQGKLSYPTIVYLDEKFNMIQPIPGYQDAKAFHQVITFLGDDHYKKTDFEKYKADKYEKTYQK